MSCADVCVVAGVGMSVVWVAAAAGWILVGRWEVGASLPSRRSGPHQVPAEGPGLHDGRRPPSCSSSCGSGRCIGARGYSGVGR